MRELCYNNPRVVVLNRCADGTCTLTFYSISARCHCKDLLYSAAVSQLERIVWQCVMCMSFSFIASTILDIHVVGKPMMRLTLVADTHTPDRINLMSALITFGNIICNTPCQVFHNYTSTKCSLYLLADCDVCCIPNRVLRCVRKYCTQSVWTAKHETVTGTLASASCIISLRPMKNCKYYVSF